MNAIFKNWKTTILGVSAFLLTWAPMLQSWVTSVKDIHVGPTQILGLLVAALGVMAKDHDVTGT